jgi:hypothetical protein
MFLQPLEDIEVEAGDELEIKCQIMGAPVPHIYAYFTKLSGESNTLRKIHPDLIKYNLETGICRVNIPKATLNGSDGYYIIKATNDSGTMSTTCKVTVLPKSFPELVFTEPTPPQFLMPLESELYVMDGQEVNLICVCKASPEPTIRWLRTAPNATNSEQLVPVQLTNDIKTNFDYLTGKCTLKISDTYPQDAGLFICVAENQLGTADTRLYLHVECKFSSLIIYIFSFVFIFYLFVINKAYVYEQDSEEASQPFSGSGSETDGTLTPTNRKNKSPRRRIRSSSSDPIPENEEIK